MEWGGGEDGWDEQEQHAQVQINCSDQEFGMLILFVPPPPPPHPSFPPILPPHLCYYSPGRCGTRSRGLLLRSRALRLTHHSCSNNGILGHSITQLKTSLPEKRSMLPHRSPTKEPYSDIAPRRKRAPTSLPASRALSSKNIRSFVQRHVFVQLVATKPGAVMVCWGCAGVLVCWCAGVLGVCLCAGGVLVCWLCVGVSTYVCRYVWMLLCVGVWVGGFDWMGVWVGGWLVVVVVATEPFRDPQPWPGEGGEGGGGGEQRQQPEVAHGGGAW